MKMFIFFSVVFALAPLTLAAGALAPRQSPTCSYKCDPGPPTTGGHYNGQSTNGPYLVCSYYTPDLYGTGPANYGCFYAGNGVSGDKIGRDQSPNVGTLELVHFFR